MVLPGFLKETDETLGRSDALHCEAITRSHARTFALASSFLPARKRRGAFAVYAFCRLADDIVDRSLTGDPDPTRLALELDLYRAGVAEALAGRPEGPVFRELWRCVSEFGVPSDVLDELLNGVACDLAPARYATWAELTSYCEGVASSVGSMCTYIFGVVGGDAVRDRAVRYARTLGVAMQLTNILRDVGEDAQRGRCYLPDDSLAAFGLSAARVLEDPTLRHDPQWAAFMRHEIARARALYRAASPGIALLEPDAQRCARACADGYAAILGAIERNGYDSFSVRARVGNWARAGLLWSVWRSGTEQPPVGIDGPVIEWQQQRLSRPEDMASCA